MKRTKCQLEYYQRNKEKLKAKRAEIAAAIKADPVAYEKQREKWRQNYRKAKAAGKVRSGERDRQYTQQWRDKNRQRVRESSKKRARRYRELAINHYGGKCACCGESAFEFLAIDHINGGGRQHILQLKKEGYSRLVDWLRINGFPSGYRVLCHNCNQALRAYGYCPHSRDVEPSCSNLLDGMSTSGA